MRKREPLSKWSSSRLKCTIIVSLEFKKSYLSQLRVVTLPVFFPVTDRLPSETWTLTFCAFPRKLNNCGVRSLYSRALCWRVTIIPVEREGPPKMWSLFVTPFFFFLLVLQTMYSTYFQTQIFTQLDITCTLIICTQNHCHHHFVRT